MVSAVKPPHYLGHRKRLRERFDSVSFRGFSEHETLEFLLTYAIPRKDTKPLAKALLARFKSLAGVLEASKDQLLSVKGVGPRTANLLFVLRPVCEAYLKNRVKAQRSLENPDLVAQYCRTALAGKGHEVIYVLFTDIRNRVVAEKILSEGSIAESPLYTRRLIEEAFACKAAGFILAHNHPSGSVDPSPADKAMTRRILKTAESMELRFIDHVIVGSEGYFSFRQEGLLERLTDRALAVL